jgi:hypothetical protein
MVRQAGDWQLSYFGTLPLDTEATVQLTIKKGTQNRQFSSIFTTWRRMVGLETGAEPLGCSSTAARGPLKLQSVGWPRECNGRRKCTSTYLSKTGLCSPTGPLREPATAPLAERPAPCRRRIVLCSKKSEEWSTTTGEMAADTCPRDPLCKGTAPVCSQPFRIFRTTDVCGRRAFLVCGWSRRAPLSLRWLQHGLSCCIWLLRRSASTPRQKWWAAREQTMSGFTRDRLRASLIACAVLAALALWTSRCLFELRLETGSLTALPVVLHLP